MTPKTLRRSNQVEAATAYAHWLTSPYMSKTDVCIKFKIQLGDLTGWMKDNSKVRPDGRKIGKGSPRQDAIRESYEKAVAEGKDLTWAVTYARTLTTSISKGELRYYAMKNDRPEIPDAPGYRQTASTK